MRSEILKVFLDYGANAEFAAIFEMYIEGHFDNNDEIY